MATTPEESQLQGLVLDTLREQGVLTSLRASLRAAVYVAIHEQASASSSELLPPPKNLKAVCQEPRGLLALALIRDALLTVGLTKCLSVYDHEVSGALHSFNGSPKGEIDAHAVTEALNAGPLLHSSLEKRASEGFPLLLALVDSCSNVGALANFDEGRPSMFKDPASPSTPRSDDLDASGTQSHTVSGVFEIHSPKADAKSGSGGEEKEVTDEIKEVDVCQYSPPESPVQNTTSPSLNPQSPVVDEQKQIDAPAVDSDEELVEMAGEIGEEPDDSFGEDDEHSAVSEHDTEIQALGTEAASSGQIEPKDAFLGDTKKIPSGSLEGNRSPGMTGTVHGPTTTLEEPDDSSKHASNTSEPGDHTSGHQHSIFHETGVESEKPVHSSLGNTLDASGAAPPQPPHDSGDVGQFPVLPPVAPQSSATASSSAHLWMNQRTSEEDDDDDYNFAGDEALAPRNSSDLPASSEPAPTCPETRNDVTDSGVESDADAGSVHASITVSEASSADLDVAFDHVEDAAGTRVTAVDGDIESDADAGSVRASITVSEASSADLDIAFDHVEDALFSSMPPAPIPPSASPSLPSVVHSERNEQRSSKAPSDDVRGASFGGRGAELGGSRAFGFFARGSTPLSQQQDEEEQEDEYDFGSSGDAGVAVRGGDEEVTTGSDAGVGRKNDGVFGDEEEEKREDSSVPLPERPSTSSSSSGVLGESTQQDLALASAAQRANSWEEKQGEAAARKEGEVESSFELDESLQAEEESVAAPESSSGQPGGRGGPSSPDHSPGLSHSRENEDAQVRHTDEVDATTEAPADSLESAEARGASETHEDDNGPHAISQTAKPDQSEDEDDDEDGYDDDDFDEDEDEEGDKSGQHHQEESGEAEELENSLAEEFEVAASDDEDGDYL